MTRARDQFTHFSDRRINLEVELGDESIVRAVGVGTVSFQRESLPPLAVSKVLYVLGLKKNLISVSTIEDKGYEVTFMGGQVTMYPKGSSVGSGKIIGVRHGRLYRFSFQPVGALVSSVEDTTQTTSNNRDLCEPWHRRMAHLHHGHYRYSDRSPQVFQSSVQSIMMYAEGAPWGSTEKPLFQRGTTKLQVY